MNLANEMRNISEIVRDCDTEFNDGYKKYIDKIRVKAQEGLREISWYDNPFFYDFDNPNRHKLCDMLKQKLEQEGFRHVYGYQIGKPMGNSQSQYIVW